jgi:hypothetical protein
MDDAGIRPLRPRHDRDVRLDSTADNLQQHALDELYGLGFDAQASDADDLEKVTKDDAMAAARRHPDLQHCAIAITRPR